MRKQLGVCQTAQVHDPLAASNKLSHVSMIKIFTEMHIVDQTYLQICQLVVVFLTKIHGWQACGLRSLAHLLELAVEGKVEVIAD